MDKYKVMVVDDQVWIRTMLMEVLDSSGYETFGASDGTEALQMAHHEKPDIALIDVTIPGLDSFSLFTHLKKVKPDVAAIFMSGFSDIDFAKKALEKGAYAFLIKPFDMEELIILLRNLSATLDLAARGENKWEMNSMVGPGIS